MSKSSTRALSWSFVLVTGDGVLSGAVGKVNALLEEHDLTPTICQIMPFGRSMMGKLYGAGDAEFLIENPGGEDVLFPLDMHEDLYRLTPVCLTLVTAAADAPAAVIRAKGKTLPERAPADTIRHFGENVIFNLIHTPDDEQAASRELHAMLGSQRAERLIAAAREASPAVVQLTGPELIDAALPAFEGSDATAFVAIANRICFRAVRHLAVESAPAHHSELGIIRARLIHERETTADRATSRERMLGVGQDARETITRLSNVAGQSGDHGLAGALRALAALFDLDGERRVEEMLAELTAKEIYVAPLERVMVQSHGLAFRRNHTMATSYEYTTRT